ncbi:hypothetical protein BMG05_18395 [Mycobacterium malmoense]|nr:hypothetical protein BMG05_18395 [Mycobacterium malmoense]
MTELSGFSPVTKLGPDLGPQSLRIPANKADAITQAGTIFEALWDAGEAGLSPNITIEILTPPSTGITFVRVTPWQADGVTKTVANPGDWIAVDGSALLGMTNTAYAAEFTQDVPLEWATTTTAPVATAAAGLNATIVVAQPTSANRPFTYVVNLTDETAGTTTQVTPTPTVDSAGNVTLPLDNNNLTDGHTYHATVTVTTQYAGVTATSAQTASFTAFDQPPADPPDDSPQS